VNEPVVMVVEDDVAIAGLLDMYLRKEGFRPLIAGPGSGPWSWPSSTTRCSRCSTSGCPTSTASRCVAGCGSAPTSRAVPDRPRRRGRPHRRVRGRRRRLRRSSRSRPKEVVARVQAILRRARPGRPSTAIKLDHGIVVDAERREATVDGETVALATQEFELLAFLARNRGSALTASSSSTGRGARLPGDERTGRRPRAPAAPQARRRTRLVTVWGVGYRLD
jgi:DNA-binding response OmpR family regulator